MSIVHENADETGGPANKVTHHPIGKKPASDDVLEIFHLADVDLDGKPSAKGPRHGENFLYRKRN